jgi:dUTP pyrophosphatase
MEPIRVTVAKADGARVPEYATDGSAGADLRAYLGEPVVVAPRERVLIPTGLRIELPAGYEAQVRPRSGLALKHGLTVANAPGTIDSDYRGEVKVILVNLGKTEFIVEPGARIAQLVVAPVSRAQFVVSGLSGSTRGEGGFGSTGVNE